MAHHQLGTHPVKRAQIASATMSCFAAHSGTFYQKKVQYYPYLRNRSPWFYFYYIVSIQEEVEFFLLLFIRSCFFFLNFSYKKAAFVTRVYPSVFNFFPSKYWLGLLGVTNPWRPSFHLIFMDLKEGDAWVSYGGEG